MAAKKKLTDMGMRALKRAAAGRRDTHWDAALPNFGVRVTDKGKATFVVMRRLRGKMMRWPVGSFEIGAYPKAEDVPVGQKLPLATAREAARLLIDQLDRGIDPRQAEEERRRAAERERRDTFGTVAEEFIVRQVTKLKSAAEVTAAIRRELVARWGSRPLKDITRRDVVAMLEEVAEDRPYIAHHLLGYARKLYNWAIARDLYGIETSPCDRVRAGDIIPAKKPRQRVLSDAELRQVWEATSELGYPLSPLVRMLLLTGQRLREVADAVWHEFDLDRALWTIPATWMKDDGRAHEIPLSDAALALLRDLPRFDGPFLFSTTSGRRPISGFSKFKLRVDATITRKLRGVPLAGWRFHDIRRTMRTHLGGLPVPSDVAEMVIAHRLGGVRGTYDLHAYREEKRRALGLWAARLQEIVEPALRLTAARG